MFAKCSFRPPISMVVKNLRMMSSKFDKYDKILTKEVNNNGLLTLNRPDKLNAFNMDMIVKISTVINAWKESKSLIVIKGIDQVFSAGGDLKAIFESDKINNLKLAKLEYELVHTIGNLKIPYVALVDGITFGGGNGLAVHGKYRIATERTVFAMPETKIGFHPDIGASYFLPRLQGKIGYYLGLTGLSLKGADVLHAGVATHYCESSQIQQLEHALLQTTNATEVDDVINRFCPLIQLPFRLAKNMEQINECFDASCVMEILNRLEKDGSDWAKKITKILRSASPLSVNVTFYQLNFGSKMSFGKCLQMDYRQGPHFLNGSDFFEGVRALVIEKDNKPKWNPARIEDVTIENILPYFEQAPNFDELDIDEKLEPQNIFQNFGGNY